MCKVKLFCMEDFPIESGGEGVDFVRTLSRHPDRALHPEEQVETADDFLQPLRFEILLFSGHCAGLRKHGQGRIRTVAPVADPIPGFDQAGKLCFSPAFGKSVRVSLQRCILPLSGITLLNEAENVFKLHADPVL